MSRPPSNTVDYFPHYIADGKKMYIVETRFGNDGYATWFKIIETLARTDFHFIDLSNEETLLFLSAKCRVTEEVLTDIVDLISKLGEFDKEIWESYKAIWCPKFIDSIQEVYRKRKTICMTREMLVETLNNPQKERFPQELGVRNTQSKVEESKPKETRVDNAAPPIFTEQECIDTFRSSLTQLGLPLDAYGGYEKLGRDFFDHYEGQNWIKGNGQKIWKVAPVIRQWLSRENSKNVGTGNTQRKRSWD